MTIDMGEVQFRDIPNEYILNDIKRNAIKYIRNAFGAYYTYKMQEYINYTYKTQTSLRTLVIDCIQQGTLEIVNNRYIFHLNKTSLTNNIPLESVCALIVNGNMSINRCTIIQDAFTYALKEL